MAILDKPQEDRPWYKRMTVMFGALTAVLQSLEPFGVVPPGSSEAANVAAGTVATSFMTLLGLYRQVASKKE